MYVESDLAFCERKFKTNKRLTVKERRVLEDFNDDLDKDSTEFLDPIIPVDPEDLKPTLKVSFNRITLANKQMRDRATLDFNLKASNGKVEFVFKHLAIAELKQDKKHVRSAFTKTMKDVKIWPERFSKYCIGMALTNPDLKHNRFKPKILKLKKIADGIA